MTFVAARAEAAGAAREDMVTRRGHVRLAVHKVSGGAFLWRLEDLQLRAEVEGVLARGDRTLCDAIEPFGVSWASNSRVDTIDAELATWDAIRHLLGSRFELDQELLALVVDACTFVVSALIVWRLPIPHDRERHTGRIDLTQTFRDIRDGLHFIATHPRVRAVIVALGVGLVGAGAMIPLGAAFAKQGLGGDSATFGVLMTALGCGAALGVIVLLVFQQRLPRETVFEFAVMGTGFFLILGAAFSSLGPSAFAIAFVGACAGTSYVTGFTTLQERVQDELRGRTFATLYTVIRLCLFLALVMSPLFADFWEWVVEQFTDDPTVAIGDSTYRFGGARLALWGGGVITLVGGFWARHSVMRAERRAREAT